MKSRTLPYLLPLCAALFAVTSTSAFSKVDGLKQKHPHSILTAHHGILSEADLVLDAQTYTVKPYNPNATGSAYWQCFPTAAVSVGYEKWRDNDAMGRADIIVTICSLDIQVHGKNLWSDYWDRRGHPEDFCKDLVGAWKELSRNEPFVCLNGEPAGVETKIVNGLKHQIRGWVWNKFKTRKGCYSYFEGACPK